MKPSAKAAAQGGQKQGTRQRAVQTRQHGEVIEWKGAYGWIRSDEKINHAEARKHGGRVYVNREDVRQNVWLYEGARVVFFAYADGDGIGAEKVAFEPEASTEGAQQNGTSGNAAAAPAERRIPGMPPPAAPEKATERRIPGMPPAPAKNRRARAAANPEGANSTTNGARSAPSAATGATNGAVRSAPAAAAAPSSPADAQPRPSGGPGAAAASFIGGYPAGGPPAASAGRALPVSSTAPSPMVSDVSTFGGGGSFVGAGVFATEGGYNCENSVAALAEDVAAAVLDDQLFDDQLPSNDSLVTKWWQCLAGDCCPISLDPLEELTCEPFGLFGVTDGDGRPPQQGVWGSQAAELVRRQSLQNVHWFNGMFLASFLVSSSQLIDPVNRRQLTRGECVSLDNYLAAHRLPAVHVTDVYDLQQAVSGSVSSGATDRIAALEREAASMLRSLFDFRSSRSRAPPPPPRPGGAVSMRPARPQGPGACRDIHDDNSQWPTPFMEDASRAASFSDAGAQRYQQRRVHEEGGLTVVDDSEFDEHWSSGTGVAAAASRGHDPTPSEMLNFNRQGASRPPKATYPARASAAAAAGGAPPGHIALASKSGNSSETAQVSFTVTGGARAARSMASSSRAYGTTGASGNTTATQGDGEEVGGHLQVCDSWVPDWATAELHQRTLEEVRAVEAMYAGAYELRSPDVYAHLRDCARRHVVSLQAQPLCFHVRQHVSGAGISFDCVLEFMLPPYYPAHVANVVIRNASASSSCDVGSDVLCGRPVLERLQQVMRKEVLAKAEGTEVVLRVLEWFSMRSAGELLRCSREIVAEQAVVAAPPVGAAASSEAESKRDRVEQARKDRLKDKYSESWDICNAFKKHGHCNAKNCQWRHELPNN